MFNYWIKIKYLICFNDKWQACINSGNLLFRENALSMLYSHQSTLSNIFKHVQCVQCRKSVAFFRGTTWFFLHHNHDDIDWAVLGMMLKQFLPADFGPFHFCFTLLRQRLQSKGGSNNRVDNLIEFDRDWHWGLQMLPPTIYKNKKTKILVRYSGNQEWP